ncbi:hypothetical protein S101258_01223 [Lactiplantibacillus plantarum subsp. plantarum]|uniref:MucBP domain-containing protein n=1 Tax=Lactiplantibacillus plantarum subsp. plantarum TaxID=337330 RepID=A0A2S3U6U7_LACPN|nr:hypothetical protein S101258_01223 [Lactiplantibacillus plantarum subsp. plantarum]
MTLTARELIGRPTMYRGKLGTPYEISAPTVAGFKLLRSVGDVTGEYTTTSKTVLFFYRNQNWQQTDLSTGFVQVKQVDRRLSVSWGNYDQLFN